jgi:hypothetical protein
MKKPNLMHAVRGNVRRATELSRKVIPKMKRRFRCKSFMIYAVYDHVNVADWNANNMEIPLDPNVILDKRKPGHRVPLDDR